MFSEDTMFADNLDSLNREKRTAFWSSQPILEMLKAFDLGMMEVAWVLDGMSKT